MEPHHFDIVGKDGTWNWDGVRADLANLVVIAENSGDFDIQLRKNYFSIYYQGSALAELRLRRNGTYAAKIHWKFLLRRHPIPELDKEKGEYHVAKDYGGDFEKQLPEGIRGYNCTLDNSGYAWFTGIHPKGANRGRQEVQQFLKKTHLLRLASNIRNKGGGGGEERMLEQVLITDNPPSRQFVIIDRQANVGGNKRDMAPHPRVDAMDQDEGDAKKMDILALRRDRDGSYHFVIVEVKLGNNPDLVVNRKGEAKVVKQLKDYVDRVRREIKEYADCYEENYRQKVRLGLLKAPKENIPKLKEELTISRNPETVRGLVVVVGYSTLADRRVKNLRPRLEENQLSIQQIKNRPRLAEVCRISRLDHVNDQHLRPSPKEG